MLTNSVGQKLKEWTATGNSMMFEVSTGRTPRLEMTHQLGLTHLEVSLLIYSAWWIFLVTRFVFG